MSFLLENGDMWQHIGANSHPGISDIRGELVTVFLYYTISIYLMTDDAKCNNNYYNFCNIQYNWYSLKSQTEMVQLSLSSCKK